MADGKIIAISISERKGQKKHNIESANLIVDHGMEGDAHAGNWHRQISLLGKHRSYACPRSGCKTW